MPALVSASSIRRFPRVLMTCAPLVASALFASVVAAAWAPQGSLLAPIPGDQLSPATLSDGAGGMFVAWNDARGSSEDIYVQHLDGNGDALWAATGVGVCTAGGTQNAVQIISDGAGGAILAWFDFRAAAGIYAQRIDATGTALWTTNGVKLTSLSCFQSFALCSDGAGGALVTYERCSTITGVDIGAQRVNSVGTVRWGATGIVICQAANDQTSPGISLTDDGTGSSIIAWADDREGTQIGNSIYAQKVTAAGAILWPAGGVPIALYVAASNHWPLRVHGDGADGAVLTWYDNGISTYKVWQQRINGLGQGQWQTGGIRVCTNTGPQYYPAVCRDGSGGSIVVWFDQRSDVYGDLYAQRISSAGALQWAPEGVPLCTAPDEQFQYSVGADGAGGAFVVWQDARADTASDIYAQHLDGAGAWQWGDANGVAIGQAPLYQVMASMAPDGQGGIVAAWEDYRNDADYDIYVTRAPSQATAAGDPSRGGGAAALRVEPSLLGRGRDAATIAMSGVKSATAELVISDVAGRVVSRETLRPSATGDVRASWSGADAGGRAVANGVYAVSLRAGERTWRRSLVVAR